MCRNHKEQAQAKEADNNTCSNCAYRQRRRRSKRKFLKFFLFVGLLWATATISYRHGGKIVGFIKMKKISKEMSLTWQQKDRLMDTFFAVRQKAFSQRKELKRLKQGFYKLMDKENLTQKELNTFIKQSMATIEKMALEHSASLLKARSILSPYQRKLLIVRLQQMERQHNRRHWRRYRSYRSQRDDHQNAETENYNKALSYRYAVKEVKSPSYGGIRKGQKEKQSAATPPPHPTTRPTTLVR